MRIMRLAMFLLRAAPLTMCVLSSRVHGEKMQEVESVGVINTEPIVLSDTTSQSEECHRLESVVSKYHRLAAVSHYRHLRSFHAEQYCAMGCAFLPNLDVEEACKDRMREFLKSAFEGCQLYPNVRVEFMDIIWLCVQTMLSVAPIILSLCDLNYVHRIICGALMLFLLSSSFGSGICAGILVFTSYALIILSFRDEATEVPLNSPPNLIKQHAEGLLRSVPAVTNAGLTVGAGIALLAIDNDFEAIAIVLFLTAAMLFNIQCALADGSETGLLLFFVVSIFQMAGLVEMILKASSLRPHGISFEWLLAIVASAMPFGRSNTFVQNAYDGLGVGIRLATPYVRDDDIARSCMLVGVLHLLAFVGVRAAYGFAVRRGGGEVNIPKYRRDHVDQAVATMVDALLIYTLDFPRAFRFIFRIVIVQNPSSTFDTRVFVAYMSMCVMIYESVYALDLLLLRLLIWCVWCFWCLLGNAEDALPGKTHNE